jgi:hypothetical protein
MRFRVHVVLQNGSRTHYIVNALATTEAMTIARDRGHFPLRVELVEEDSMIEVNLNKKKERDVGDDGVSETIEMMVMIAKLGKGLTSGEDNALKDPEDTAVAVAQTFARILGAFKREMEKEGFDDAETKAAMAAAFGAVNKAGDAADKAKKKTAKGEFDI